MKTCNGLVVASGQIVAEGKWISAHSEKGKTMTEREKLVELLDDGEAKGFFRYGTDCHTGEVGGHEMTPEDIADYLIENGVTFAKDTNVHSWVPVTERLPVDWCPVLVMIRDVEKPLLGSYRGNVWFHEMWNTNFINGAVTHWMPLPEAPKEVSE